LVKEENNMKQTTIVMIILAVLVATSLVQAVQLSGLQNTIEEKGVSLGAAAPVRASSGSGGSPASLPSSLQDLPTMVGGC